MINYRDNTGEWKEGIAHRPLVQHHWTGKKMFFVIFNHIITILIIISIIITEWAKESQEVDRVDGGASTGFPQQFNWTGLIQSPSRVSISRSARTSSKSTFDYSPSVPTCLSATKIPSFFFSSIFFSPSPKPSNLSHSCTWWNLTSAWRTQHPNS